MCGQEGVLRPGRAVGVHRRDLPVRDDPAGGPGGRGQPAEPTDQVAGSVHCARGYQHHQRRHLNRYHTHL